MPAKKTTIVVADDDPQLLRLVTRNLEFEGYAPIAAADGQAALEAIERGQPDLALLDVMMPKLDGFAVCERVRAFSSVPIIILTARGQDQDKIHGFDVGADDYLTKPFNVDELLARVRAVLRRSQLAGAGGREGTGAGAGAGSGATLDLGPLHLDFVQHLAVLEGQELPLTPIEYRLLAYLAQNAGRVVTQDLLLEHVWGPEYVGESHLLQVNVNRLRRKLEPEGSAAAAAQPQRARPTIRTKVGIGYQLVPPPPPASAPASAPPAAPSAPTPPEG
ncbi:MAG TPA: response regulator transcription factor [Ktedonobacterales bacterium]